MTSHHDGGASNDPFELLRAANPVPDPADLELPPLEQLVPEAFAPRPPARRRRRRHVLWVAPVAALVTGSVAAALIAQRTVTNPLEVGCYAAPDLAADTVVVRAESDGADAVAACERLWRQGEIGDASAGVPPLTACVLPTGAVGVFPGGPDVCERIGMGERPGGPEPTQAPPAGGDDPAAVIRLRDALVDRTRATGCLLPDEGRRAAQDELREQGLTGWSIEVGPGATGSGFDDERPCVSYSVEPERRIVVLVPFPRRG